MTAILMITAKRERAQGISGRQRPYRAEGVPPPFSIRRVSLVLAGLSLLAAWALAAAPVRAQVAPPGGAAAPRDSVEARERAQEAQARFERIRRLHLPWTWRPGYGPCDERIGRFCFWHEGDGDPWEPPPEDPEVAEVRAELLSELARAAEEIPGDGWVVGQRVRYLVEAGRPAEAAGVAARCRAERWWCAALEGYALHAAEDFAAAGAAFDSALAVMPAEARERWTDLELLLDRPARRRWRELAPAGRRALARRAWWLADPLWSVPGNERRSEHFSRRVHDAMQEGSAPSGHAVGWGADLRELLLRYGQPVGWERVRESSGSLSRGLRPSVVGHDPPGGRRFLPAWEWIGAPTLVGSGEWRLDVEKPRSTYAPGYAGRFVDLEHQLAVFRRSGAAVVVVAFALDPLSVPGAAEVEAALVIATDPDTEPRIARRREEGATGVVVDTVPWAAAVVSVEALAREERIAGRARYGLPIDGSPDRRPAVSDLLLLAGRGAPPDSLAAALSRVRPTTRVRPGVPLVLYFEIYPPPGARSARISLALRDRRGGFWRGLGAALGVVDADRDAVATAWSESLPGDPAVHPRSLTVELPELPPGSYSIELAAEFGEDGAAVRRRSITVQEPRR